MKEASVRLGEFALDLSPEVVEKLHRSAVAGGLLVEFGTPSLFGHQTIQQRADRHTSVNEKNVCAKIVSVHYDESTGQLRGVIQPHGPKSKLIKQLIERDQADRMVLGIRTHISSKASEIIGFDLVRF